MVQRLPVFTTSLIGLARLNTLPDRFVAAFQATLSIRIGEVCDQIVKDAQAQLRPGHGYDTGLLHDTLQARLVGIVNAVLFRIDSPQAAYWAYVEFGHMLRNGEWWEGYHFIENAVEMNADDIWRAARTAFHDAARITRGGVSVGQGISLLESALS